MPFGICHAPEDFQSDVKKMIQGLDEDYAIAGDLITTGTVDTWKKHRNTMIVIFFFTQEMQSEKI